MGDYINHHSAQVTQLAAKVTAWFDRPEVAQQAHASGKHGRVDTPQLLLLPQLPTSSCSVMM